MKDPRVSVVIPTYNRPDQLKRAIESVLSQTLQDIEVIIIDDGSETDNSSVIEEFDNEKLKYTCHKTNKGGSAARNTGIEKARGKYIAFLDDDDEWKPSKLAHQVSILEEVSDDWVGAYCDVERKRSSPIVGFVESMIPSRTDVVEGGEELIAEIMMKRLHLGGSSTMIFRSEAIDSMGGFDESFDRHQDIEFIIRMLKIGKLKFVNKPLVIRYDTEPPSLEAIERSNIKYMAAFSDEIFRLKQRGEDVLGVQEFWLAKSYFQNGRIRLGIGSLIKSEIPRMKDYFVMIYFILIGIRKTMKI